MNLELWRQRFFEFSLQNGLRPRTAEGYGGELRLLFSFLESVGVGSLPEVSKTTP